MSLRESGQSPPDVLCVGDVATDVYIALRADHVTLLGEGPARRLVLPFGAKVPFERSETVEAGGDAANVAVALSRLGLRVGLASYLGGDRLGRDILVYLGTEHVDVSLVQLDPSRPTNEHFVLWLEGERTILVHHEDYHYHWPPAGMNHVPTWLYLTSISEHGEAYQDAIAEWLVAHPAVSLALEPGTFQIEQGAARLAPLYRRAELVVCNRDEALRVTGLDAAAGAVELLDALLALGPRRAVVTDARAGATGADARGHYRVPMFPDDGPVVDRTGAGDAFASTLVASLVEGRPFTEALRRAPVNAMSVVRRLGSQAGLLDARALEAHLDAAPPDYAVHALEGPPSPGGARVA
ncbi:MAG TPA: carbohydrate kinase family protein [Acidimicrobiales bacterium]|nr:carbohydrate kinase family protein [Acidimicrobiales bacterium]